MPTSTWVHVTHVVNEMNKYKPKKFLDIGVGFGRWGFLARECLDIIRGRIFQKDWQTQIDGIEIYAPYITEIQKQIYDNIFIVNAENFLKINKPGTYDMIIAGDVIEHFEKNKAKEIIDLCVSLCNKCFILAIPLGSDYKQGTVAGNVHETHLSTWTLKDFESDKRIVNKFITKEAIKNRPYGVFTYEKK